MHALRFAGIAGVRGAERKLMDWLNGGLHCDDKSEGNFPPGGHAGLGGGWEHHWALAYRTVSVPAPNMVETAELSRALSICAR